MTEVAIAGIGLHRFGRSEGMGAAEQGAVALRGALKDAGIAWRDVHMAYGGASPDSGNADAVISEMGLTSVPFINVWNGCATGGSALNCAYNAIRSGEADIAVAVGFDKHPSGAFNAKPGDWGLEDWYGEAGMMLTTQFFAMKIQRYMALHGISEDCLARVAEKAFYHGSLNPQAWRQQALSAADIAQSAMVSHPLRKYMFCSPSEGGAALVLCSAKKARELGVSKPVWIKAAVVRSRHYGSFEVFSPGLAAEDGEAPTVTAARAAYEKACLGPEDMDVLQLQDTESGAEIMHMAENGFCEHGEQESLIREGATRIDGRLPINTDGGCLANGEPIGASGLRQVYEICLQLRGDAGRRQVSGEPKTGYTHVYGAPGVSGVNIFQR